MRRLVVNKFFLPRTPWQRSFLVTLFFVTIASLLFWLDFFRVYKSEMNVLVITRSSNVVTEQVVANLIDLAKNLSFYERVLSQNDLLDDDFEGQTKDKRKALWNGIVTVSRSAQSGVLVVSAIQNTSEKAQLLSKETVKALFAVTAFYYNIKTDVDVRVVDGPIVQPIVGDVFWYGATSFGSALFITTLFFLTLSLIPYLFRGRKRVISLEHINKGKSPEKAYPTFAVGDAVPFIDPRKFVPAKPLSLSFESSNENEEEYIRKEISPVTADTSPLTSAPIDTASEKLLPGMDIDVSELPFQFEEVSEERASIESEKKLTKEEVVGDHLSRSSRVAHDDSPVAHQVIVPEEKKEVKRGEPSIEEYKRRLNELLAGGK